MVFTLGPGNQLYIFKTNLYRYRLRNGGDGQHKAQAIVNANQTASYTGERSALDFDHRSDG